MAKVTLFVVIKCTLSLALILSIVESCRGENGRLIDLSYTFNKDAPQSPLLIPFKLEVVKKGFNKFGTWSYFNNFCASEHSGTHIDAPIHFSQNSWSLDQIPLERLYRVPGVMINVSYQSHSMQNYEIKPKDLERWESKYGTIPDGAVVLLHTGWGKKSNNFAKYSGIDEFKKFNFPGLGVSAAEWIASHGSRHGHSLGIIGVGIDTFSLDVGQSVRFPAHAPLMKNNIYGMENVAHTHKLPAKGFLLTLLPMKISEGSGVPVRLTAELTDEAEFSNSNNTIVTDFMLILCAIFYYIAK